jgi:glycosyltransferase involved in cell wall biosynthesis
VGKILIIHYRVGKTDGVSLEISNWIEIFKRMGWDVETCAGPVSLGANYIIENLEPQLNKKVFTLNEEAFGGFKKYSKESFVREKNRVQKNLYNNFCSVFRKSKPDRIIVSNIFSVGENISAPPALLEAIRKFKIPTIAICHDFWWENGRYLNPSCPEVRDLLYKFIPPKDVNIKYVVINKIAKKTLAQRKGLFADILHDCIDFAVPNLDKNGVCKKLLKEKGVNEDDLVVLQGTRIVYRKNIETAMEFVKLLAKKMPVLGRKRVVFVMSGYAEKRDEWYQVALRKHAKNLEINTVEINGLVNNYHNKNRRNGNFLDIYPYADLVTYPSVYEGFGNQFLEAIYAKKPIVMLEYPVYRTDIKPFGFEIISLGKRVSYDHQTQLAHVPYWKLEDAVDRLIKLLKDKREKKRIVEKNFAIGKKEFSFESASKVWKRLLWVGK